MSGRIIGRPFGSLRGGRRKRRPRTSRSIVARAAFVEALEERVLLAAGWSTREIDYSILSPDAQTALDGRAYEVRVANIAAGDERLKLGDNEVLLLSSGPHPSQLRLDAPDNRNAADTQNSDQLVPGGSLNLDLNGNGLTVGVWEAGSGYALTTHTELAGRITIGDSGGGTASHATQVTGVIAATGINPEARGMASEVNVRAYTSSNAVTEMANDASLLDATNHSYSLISGWRVTDTCSFSFLPCIGTADVWYADRSSGVEDEDFGKYTSGAQSLDNVLFNNPDLTSFWSSGNERNDVFTNARGDNTYVTYQSSLPGWALVTNSGATAAPGRDGNNGTGFDSLNPDQSAKNNITIGAVLDVKADPVSESSVTTTSFSSYGPTDDGRIKPDLVANGASVFTTDDAGNTAYASVSGTSFSSPAATGAALQLIEHYNDLAGQKPRSATIKGTMIHTATDSGNLGPDFRYGWGLINAAAAAELITEANREFPDDTIQQLSYSGSDIALPVQPDGGPLMVTIVWTDPAGNPHPSGSFSAPGGFIDTPTPVLVNDLDLSITDCNATTHFPWTLDVANPANPAVRNQQNHVDNVEQVLIDAPAACQHTISVNRTGATFNQDFTLIVSGTQANVSGVDLRGVSIGVPTSDLDAAGGQVSVNFQLENRGDTAAGASDVQYYLSDDRNIDPTTDLLLNLDASDPNYDGAEPEAFHVASLAAGATLTDSVTLAVPTTDPFGTDGQYFIGMIVDADADVAEADENNNGDLGEGTDYDEVNYQVVASVPFFEGWELSAPCLDCLAPYWEAIEAPESRIRITNEGTPFNGNYHIALDVDHDQTGTLATNQLILHVNLLGHSGVTLDFANREYGDEDNAGIDAVEISVNDGASWTTISSLVGSNSTETYTLRSFNLDSLGLTYSSDTLIRFQQRDNFIINFASSPVNSDGFSFDDIRITSESAPSPQIDVRGNGVAIADGDITPSTADHTDFGTPDPVSGTLVRTFTIQNDGDADLNLTGTPLVQISGTHALDFTVTSLPSSTVPSGGGSTTFQITFNPSGPGLRSATVSIDNDDPNANPYDFVIQGLATAPLQIIDNGDGGYSTVGANWFSGSGFGHDGDFELSPAGSGSELATWTFFGLSPGMYRVSATWLESQDLATNAPFTIFDGVTPLAALNVNQQVAPNDFVYQETSWQFLGDVYEITAGSLVVQLSDAADNAVLADAIHIEQIPGIIIDNGDSGYSTVGPDWLTNASGLGFDGDIDLHSPGSGSEVARWTFSGLTPGNYRVSASWFPIPSLATDAPFTVFDGATPLSTVTVNQQLEPSTTREGGVLWERLGGMFAITGNELVVELSNLADGIVSADAVHIERLAGTIIDDEDSGYSTIGGWFPLAVGLGFGFNGDFDVGVAGTGADVAIWTFAGLTPGQYRVSATWLSLSGLATDAPFTILDGATPVGTVDIDLTEQPNEFASGGAFWQDLGSPYLITGNTLVVQLSDEANSLLLADAVRIERVGELLSPPSLSTPELSGIPFATSKLAISGPLAMGDVVDRRATRDLLSSPPIEDRQPRHLAAVPEPIGSPAARKQSATQRTRIDRIDKDSISDRFAALADNVFGLLDQEDELFRLF